MEPLLTEGYSPRGPEGAADHPMLGRREMVSGLPWGRKGSRKALPGDGSCQAGERVVQKKRLDSGSWQRDFESKSDCEEMHWGCFYFFPWLRMWRRERRGRRL